MKKMLGKMCNDKHGLVFLHTRCAFVQQRVCVAVAFGFFGWSYDTVHGLGKAQKRVNSSK